MIYCLQSHLAEGTISVFSDIDILVTFGKENDTKKIRNIRRQN